MEGGRSRRELGVGSSYTTCMVCMFVGPQDSYVRIPASKMTVLGGGASRRRLGQENGALMERSSPPTWEHVRRCYLLSPDT